MGPDGGKKGGMIVDEGSPMKIARDYKKTKSYTGEYLAKEFESMK
jgi:excinuclease ABC subunit A